MALKKLYALHQNNSSPETTELLQSGEELLIQTATQLQNAVNTALTAIQYTPDAEYLRLLSNSIWVFSGAKTFHQLQNISALLLDTEGNLKPFYKFRDEAKLLHPKYNENYLRSEYNHAVSSAQMAAKWKQYEAGANRYNLQYRTAGDERVRKTHNDLNNTTLPMTDAFWNEYYPPNGWGCRCSAIEVKKDKYKQSDSQQAVEYGKTATTQINKNGENTLLMFRTNTAKQGVVFPETHPYYNIRKKDFTDVKQFSRHLQYQKKYETLYGDKWEEGFEIAEMIDIPENFSLENKLRLIAKESQNAENELLFVLDKNGTIVERVTGTRDEVLFDLDVENNIIIHNHPSKLPHSIYDVINISSEGKALRNIVVSGNKLYSIDGFSNIIDNKTLKSKYYEYYNDTRSKYITRDDVEEAEIEWLNEILTKLAKHFNFQFYEVNR